MQVDPKLLPYFDFNESSEQGSLIASINNANLKAQNNDQKKVDFSLISKLLDIKIGDSEACSISTTDEDQFLTQFNQEIKPQRDSQKNEMDERILRKKEAEKTINEKIQKEKEEEDTLMNEEFDRILDEQKKKQAEAEFKIQQEQQRKDDLCFKLASESLDGDYDMAKIYLTQHNWDFEKVTDMIKKQKEEQSKLEEQREQKIINVIQSCHWETDFDKIRSQLIDCNWDAAGLIARLQKDKQDKDNKEQEEQHKIMEVIQQCEELNDFDQIRAMLVANNWNVQVIVNQEKSKNQTQLLMVNCAKQTEKLLLTFQKGQAFGNTIIEQLLQIKPLVGSGDAAAYNIYRDPGKQQCVNYIMLSNRLEDMGLEQQPNAPAAPGQTGQTKILYFNQDMAMKFD